MPQAERFVPNYVSGRPQVNGVEVALKGEGYAVHSVTELATAFELHELTAVPILTGSFVATRTDPILDIEAIAVVAGQAQCPLYLYVGPSATLVNASQQPVGSTVAHLMGRIWYDSSIGQKSQVKLTGLTVGTTYYWGLYSGIVGGSEIYPVGTDPNRFAVSPDGKWGCVSLFTAGGVQLFYLAQPFADITGTSPGDEPGPIILTGNWPWGVALSNTKAVVCNFLGETVTVIDLATQAIERTITMPAGASPRDVVLSADGATAWVACDDGIVRKITVATGAFTNITVDSGKDLRGIAITADGSKVFVGNFTDSEIFAITVSNSAVSAATAITGNVEQVRAGPTSIWVLSDSGTFGRLTEINQTTNAVAAGPYQMSYDAPKDFAITPGGRTAYVVFASGYWAEVFLTGSEKGGNHALHIGRNTTNHNGGTYTGDLTGVATNLRGEIWVVQWHGAHIWKWPGASLSIDPSNTLSPGRAKVTVYQ